MATALDPQPDGPLTETDANKVAYINSRDVTYMHAPDVCLGTGGFCNVYKARINACNKTVAIKVLKPDAKNEAKCVFAQEACHMRRVVHTNILKLLAMLIEGEAIIGLVLPLMVLRSLDNFMDKIDTHLKSGMPWWRLKALWLVGIAEGMCHLHNQEPIILHLDLKPGNVLICHESLQPKISDFGLARSKEKYSQTAEGASTNKLGGTLKFTPPEYLDNPYLRPADKFDVYSYGLTLYFIVTETSAFLDIPNEDIKAFVCSGNRPQLCLDRVQNQVLNNIVAQLNNLTACCWEQQAGRRPIFTAILAEARHICTPLLEGNDIQELLNTFAPTVYLSESRGPQCLANVRSPSEDTSLCHGIVTDMPDIADVDPSDETHLKVRDDRKNVRLSVEEEGSLLEDVDVQPNAFGGGMERRGIEDIRNVDLGLLWRNDHIALVQGEEDVRGVSLVTQSESLVGGRCLFVTHDDEPYLYVYHDQAETKRIGKVCIPELEDPAWWGSLVQIPNDNTITLAIVGQDSKFTRGTLHILDVDFRAWEISTPYMSSLAYGPHSVTVDHIDGHLLIIGNDHRIHVVDSHAHEVKQIIPDEKEHASIFGAEVKPSEYVCAMRLAPDIYVLADYDNNRLDWYNPQGVFQFYYPTSNNQPQLIKPRVLLLHQGNILAACKHAVFYISAQGEFLGHVTPTDHSEPTHIYKPRCMSVCEDRLYVGHRRRKRDKMIPEVKIVTLSNYG